MSRRHRCDSRPQPSEAHSNDPEVLRAALVREADDRRRSECMVKIQTGAVQLALDLLVREPDIEGFFGEFTRKLVELCDSHACGVWLIDPAGARCELWMAYLEDRLHTPKSRDWESLELPRESLAAHLFAYKQGWASTIEYDGADERLPEAVRAFNTAANVGSLAVAPLVLGGRNLGWIGLSTLKGQEAEGPWRLALLEAIARQATLALHQNRLLESSRVEERRKAILEERNRLARDIHDNLAQGFAAILMQLQAAQREAALLSPAVAASLDNAVALARTHLVEARRSVGTLRPNVGGGEDLATMLRRLAELGQRTTTVPIRVVADELPRLGDGVEREILSIVHEALTNAVRHARAQEIVIRASAVHAIGIRVSVSDDGRGMSGGPAASGFGMTSMQERAERIGASLTVVTAPRSGTEVVLAWDPAALPTQVHVAV